MQLTGGVKDYKEPLANVSLISKSTKFNLTIKSEVQQYLDELEQYIGDEYLKMKSCGKTAIKGKCSGGHEVLKILNCGREWCPICGQDGSNSHNRRISRWLSKAMQMESIGVWIIEFTLYDREQMRSKKELKLAEKHIKNWAKKYYKRGLTRWHWWGDKPENGQEYDGDHYNPHYNILVDGNYIDPKVFEDMKKELREKLKFKLQLKDDVIMNYHFDVEVGRKYHSVKYTTRATLRNLIDDPEICKELKGFRNQTWFGKGEWEGEAVWQLTDIGNEPEQTDSDIKNQMKLQQIFEGVCPICEGIIDFKGGEYDFPEKLEKDFTLRKVFDYGGFQIYEKIIH